MLKVLLITLVVSATLFGCASLQPIPESERTFSAAFAVPDATNDKIYDATKLWLAENFRSAKCVIKYESKGNEITIVNGALPMWRAENFRSAKCVMEYENQGMGILIANGAIPYPCSGFECVVKTDWSVPFTMRVDMKDQKFKLTFFNVRISWPPFYDTIYGIQPGYEAPICSQGELDAIKPKLISLGDELISAIQNKNELPNW